MPIYLGETLIQGGAKEVEKKYVNFHDYDGTRLYSYTLDEARALTSLPKAPKHDTLEFESWNWTLDEIKANHSPINVGANYITKDRTTKLYVGVKDNNSMLETLSYLHVKYNGTIHIDWGDETVTEETSANVTEITFEHAYSFTGNAVISISVTDGTVYFCSGNNGRAAYYLSSLNYGKVEGTSGGCPVKSIECGSGVYFYNNCFVNSQLETISVSNSTQLEWKGFNARYLKAFVVPYSWTTSGWKDRLFDASYDLEFMSFPKSMVSMDMRYSFCTNKLEDLMIPWPARTGDAFTNSGFAYVKNIICTVDATGTYQLWNDGVYSAVEHIYLLEQTTVPALNTVGGWVCIKSAKIHVPASLYNDFIADEAWAPYAANIVSENV